MWSVLITLIVCAVAGFVAGIGVLVTQENPKVGEFLKNRPVIGWTLAFLAGGIAISVILYLLEMAALGIIGLILR